MCLCMFVVVFYVFVGYGNEMCIYLYIYMYVCLCVCVCVKNVVVGWLFRIFVILLPNSNCLLFDHATFQSQTFELVVWRHQPLVVLTFASPT